MSTSNQRRLAQAWCQLCIAMGLAGHAVAQAPAGPQEEARTRTWLQWQGTQAQVDSSARFSAWMQPGTGSLVSLEDDLNVDNRNLINLVQFGRRIGDRWRVEVAYESNRRNGDTELPRALDIGGLVVAQGKPTRSVSLLTVLRVNGGYAFVLTPETEVGLAFGGQSLRVSLRMEPTDSSGSDYSASDVGVVALLGLYGSHRLGAGPWSINGRATLGLDDGHYSQVQLGLDWNANRHLKFGLGYQFSRARLSTELGTFYGISYLDLNYRTHGPTVSVQLAY